MNCPIETEGANLTSRGREFHRKGAACEKALKPYVRKL